MGKKVARSVHIIRLKYGGRRLKMQGALERRQEILSVISSRRHDTIDNLAFEFGVSRRTIRYDIEALSMDNPIYTTQGGGGGVHMVDGCFAGRKYITDKQEELLRRLLSGLTGEDVEIMNCILKSFAVPKKGVRRDGK
jgi:predicted ArsR family transcriptional regulator